jgi:hypothetical protein
MADDGYVTIHRTTDVAQGEMLAELFKREGIPARFHKVSSTLIGMPALLIEMNVAVPAESEARARELLRDLEYTAAADAAETGDDEGPAPTQRSRWRALARAGFTLLLPGTVHLYAGRPWTALVLAAGAVTCVIIAANAQRGSVSFGVALATVFAIMGCDMVSGVRAATAETRGKPVGKARQVGLGFALLAVAVALGAAARTVAAAPDWWRSHVLKRFRVTCTTSGLMIENGGDDDRELVFHRVGMAAATGPGGREEIFDVPLASGPVLRLRADTTERLPFGPELGSPDVCREPAGCRFVFDVTIGSTEQGPLPLHAAGECTPVWGEISEPVAGRLELSASDGE